LLLKKITNDSQKAVLFGESTVDNIDPCTRINLSHVILDKFEQTSLPRFLSFLVSAQKKGGGKVLMKWQISAAKQEIIR
jgi:hypothetical protein